MLIFVQFTFANVCNNVATKQAKTLKVTMRTQQNSPNVFLCPNCEVITYGLLILNVIECEITRFLRSPSRVLTN